MAGHVPYMLPMMMPGVPSMCGMPGMFAGGLSASILVGAGHPAISLALPLGLTLSPAGGLPYSEFYRTQASGIIHVPIMLRGAMPAAGMLP